MSLKAIGKSSKTFHDTLAILDVTSRRPAIRGIRLRSNGEIEDLICCVAAGDRAAFRALYKATSPKLFGVAMRILKDAQKAADAVQDAYIQIWRHAGRYDEAKGAGEAWIISIARFRAIDIIRRDRARREIEDRADDEIEHAEPAGDGLNMVESTLTLRECLKRIGGDQRKALLEVHLNGYTSEELAARHNIPLGTIKSRVRRGLKNLRTCMEQSS